MIPEPLTVILIGIFFGTAIIVAGVMKMKRKAIENKKKELDTLK